MTIIKRLKQNLFIITMLTICFTIVSSCNSDDDDDESNELELVGQDGNPRFNLQFNNEENVDLDLYVKTPSGSIIYYGNSLADEGELDVDCLCFGCPQGPNENIFWENGTAPNGTYEYWVDYFGYCTSPTSSDFSLRVIQNGVVLTTKTGSLSGGQSEVFTHIQE